MQCDSQALELGVDTENSDSESTRVLGPEVISLVIFLILLPLISLLLVLFLQLILNLKGAKELGLTSFDEDLFTYLVESDPNSFKKAMDSCGSPF